MKVFVAGATGAVGRQLLPQLVAAGHDVVGMVRRRETSELVRGLGGAAGRGRRARRRGRRARPWPRREPEVDRPPARPRSPAASTCATSTATSR